MLIQPISREQFAIFALALPEGPNFEPLREVSWWSSDRNSSVGIVTYDPRTDSFGGLALRRDVDHQFRPTPLLLGLPGSEQALVEVTRLMKPGDPPDARPPGARRRSNLFDVKKGVTTNPKFDLLRSTLHHRPALYALGEVYLALDHPDDNFVRDFQTEGFDARLWELYLFAAFREQAISVGQTLPSPDFHLQKDGMTLFVEAVTAKSRWSPHAAARWASAETC